jgi:hypothetical protein
MSSARTRLCAFYLAVAVLALVGTWRQNLAFMREVGVGLAEGFAAFWPALLANRATVSITIDIFLFGLAATVWMVLEARRVGVRFVWLYVLFGFLIAISVTFPLFLVARERRLAAIDADATEPTPSLGDKLGLAVLSAGMLAFTLWCTLR